MKQTPFRLCTLLFAVAPVNSLIGTLTAPRLVGHPFNPQGSEEKSNLHECPRPCDKIDDYEAAFRVIDDCAAKEEPSERLSEAVRYIEVKGYNIYPDLASKLALWNQAHGSWKLVLVTGSAKCHSFHPPRRLPFLSFSYAMIDDLNFGNGIGPNEQSIWLSFLHKHMFEPKIRHMIVLVEDIFLFGIKATHMIPTFLCDWLNLGKTPEDFGKEDRPPTFVIVGASKKALIARGNRSGGLAIWSRMQNDIRPVAYKGYYE
jgi:hypothetical protein